MFRLLVWRIDGRERRDSPQKAPADADLLLLASPTFFPAAATRQRWGGEPYSVAARKLVWADDEHVRQIQAVTPRKAERGVVTVLATTTVTAQLWDFGELAAALSV